MLLVLDDNGDGTLADIAEGIRYAVDNGASVINMSLGVDASSNMRRDNGAMDKALNYAYAKGVTVVAAAGNENVNKQVSYPSIYPTVISVGATDYRNQRAPYSNSGYGLNIVAPGGNTLVDLNGDGYGDGILQEAIISRSSGLHFYQGTSMATPHVTAAAALLIAANVAKSPDDVRLALTKSAKNLGTSGYDRTFGHGLLQVYSALTMEFTTSNPSPTPVNVGRSNPVTCNKLRNKKGCRKRVADGCRWRRRRCRKVKQ
jgi:serine protease